MLIIVDGASVPPAPPPVVKKNNRGLMAAILNSLSKTLLLQMAQKQFLTSIDERSKSRSAEVKAKSSDVDECSNRNKE